MYMHNKKIIICKFNLKNVCHYGDKCKFRHLSVRDLNEILSKMEDLKLENNLLKSELKEKNTKICNFTKMSNHVINDKAENQDKILFSSFFKENNQVIQTSNANDSGFDEKNCEDVSFMKRNKNNRKHRKKNKSYESSRSSANENKISQFLTDDKSNGHVGVNLQAEKINICGQNLNEMIESNNININLSYFDRKIDDNAYKINNIEEKLNKHHQQL